MREFVQSQIDDQNRYHLPKDMRDSYGWDTTHALSIAVCRQSGTATIAELQDQPALPNMHCRLNEFGFVTLPKAAMGYLGWAAKDKISAAPTKKGHAITLAMAKKYKPYCKICTKPEEHVVVNNTGICKSCAQIISKSLQPMG